MTQIKNVIKDVLIHWNGCKICGCGGKSRWFKEIDICIECDNNRKKEDHIK